jgi:hypothetical protein
VTDSGFYEISSDQFTKLRQPVMDRLEKLAQSTNWLSNSYSEETSRVKMAIGGVIDIIKQCLDIEPKERPPAEEITAQLGQICIDLQLPQPW